MARRLARGLGLAGGVAALLAGALWLGGVRWGAGPAGGTAVIGDRAQQILAALGTGQALPISSAALTVVAVDGWERLGYISDMQRLCGAACSGDTAMVRALRLQPGGSRKVLFLDLSAAPRASGQGQQTAQGEAEPAPDFACLARVIEGEAARLGAAQLPACARPAFGGAPGARTLWILPFGFGTL